jgi:hypothetical protein
MFYESTDIDRFLICCICNQRLSDARLLPCGKLCCNTCIHTLADQEKNFECQHCTKTHNIPKEGFAEISSINQIVGLKPNEVSRGHVVQDLKRIFKLIQKKYNEIKCDQQISDTVIWNHCDEERNNSQLAVEEAYKKLGEIKDDFLNQIDNYELQCKRKLQSSLKENGVSDLTLEEIKKFCEDAETCLKSFSIDRKVLESLVANGNNLFERIENIHYNIRSDFFNGIQLKFYKNSIEFAPESIGCIKRQNFDIFYLNNICRVNEIDFTTRFNDIKRGAVIRNFYFRPILNQNFLIVYQNKNNNLNFVQLDNSHALRTIRKNVIVSTDIPFFNIFVCSDVFFVFTVEKILQFENLPKLRSFGFDFDLISEFQLKSYPEFMKSFENLIFIGEKDNDCLTLKCYNSSFEIIQNFSNTNNFLPIVFPNQTGFLNSDEYFIFCQEIEEDRGLQKIILVRKINGEIEESFTIDDFHSWHIYCKKYILTYDNQKNIICCFNFKGDLIEVSNVNEKKKFSNFEFSFKKELFFIRNNENEIKGCFF